MGFDGFWIIWGTAKSLREFELGSIELEMEG